jgi:hypothetical protein
MPAKRYLVTLTPEERDRLTRLTHSGKGSARTLTRARILLKADQAEGGRPGRTPASPRPWMSATAPSSGSGSGSSSGAWTRPWRRPGKRGGGPASSTAPGRPA